MNEIGSEWPAACTMVLIYLFHVQLYLNPVLGPRDRHFQGQLCPPILPMIREGRKMKSACTPYVISCGIVCTHGLRTLWECSHGVRFNRGTLPPWKDTLLPDKCCVSFAFPGLFRRERECTLATVNVLLVEKMKGRKEGRWTGGFFGWFPP